MRISEVTERTGVSRELIHHYLRQGLLPRPETRAQYSESQVRLLQQIKVLREEHHLPLETIRSVFDFFGRDADRIEALTLADSFANRMARLTDRGEALSSRTLSHEKLAQAAGLTPAERLDPYLQAGLIRPLGTNGERRYSAYDARVLAVCERALAVGVPFESLRTIASFVRVAFDLEQPALLPTPGSGDGDADGDDEGLLTDAVVRLELVISFIQSLLQGLIAHRLRDGATLEPRDDRGLDALVYRPSDLFVDRHGLTAAIDAAQSRLHADAQTPRPWQRTVSLLLHAGRYREALFFAEQAHERWPDHEAVTAQYGRALLLLGRTQRGLAQLEDAAPPADRILALLARVTLLGEQDGPELSSLTAVPRALRAALGQVEQPPGEQNRETARAARAARLEAWILGGWLWTALPSALRRADHGQRLMREAYDELQQRADHDFPLSGQRRRLLINAAWLLYEARVRAPRELRPEQRERGVGRDAPASPSNPSPLNPESLRSRICRLDPGCDFARRAYADAADDAGSAPASDDGLAPNPSPEVLP